MRAHTTEGYPPFRCVRCHTLLLYGTIVGALRCKCGCDNIKTLDDLRKWVHTYIQTSSVPTPLQSSESEVFVSKGRCM